MINVLNPRHLPAATPTKHIYTHTIIVRLSSLRKRSITLSIYMITDFLIGIKHLVKSFKCLSNNQVSPKCKKKTNNLAISTPPASLTLISRVYSFYMGEENKKISKLYYYDSQLHFDRTVSCFHL